MVLLMTSFNSDKLLEEYVFFPVLQLSVVQLAVSCMRHASDTLFWSHTVRSLLAFHWF